MDADGYPTEEELEKIRTWSHPKYDYTGLLDYVGSHWWYPEYFHKEPTKAGAQYKISTGGWSGNEELIGALQENLVFWGLCWVSSRRGGHYEFETRKLADD